MTALRPARSGGHLSVVDEGLDRATAALARGGPVLMVDTFGDPGWLLCAAAVATEEFVQLASACGLGPLRAAVEPERLKALGIAPVEVVSGLYASVDAVGARGGLAADRIATLRALADPAATAGSFVLPGQISPMVARDCSLDSQPCVSRAIVELVRRSGAPPVAGCIPVADVRRCRDRSARDLPLVSLYEVLATTEPVEDAVARQVEAALPTRDGGFVSIAFGGLRTGSQYVALRTARCGRGARVHLHQRCLVADVFRSPDCGCAQMLSAATAEIRAGGEGVIICRVGDAHPLGTAPRQLQAGWPVTVEVAAIMRSLGLNDVVWSANELTEESALRALGIRSAPAWAAAAPAEIACS